MRRARGKPARSRRGDAHLLRRAAWTVALQTALAVALVVLIVTAGSVLLFDRQQAEEVREVLQHSATTADDVADPPVGVWLVQVRAPRGNAPGQRTVSAGTPQPAAQASVLDRASPGPLSIEANSQQWTAWVDLRANSRFVAIYDWRLHTSEEHRLLVAITTAGLVGIALAALIGGIVGKRAVRPLGEALALQRRFVADASHELRTPLAVVNTRAQLLRLQQSGADPQLSSELAQLVADTRVLGDVVTDLLTSAQLEHSPPLGEDIDVVALCEALVASLTPYARQHDVHLETQVLGQSPRLAYHVRGHPPPYDGRYLRWSTTRLRTRPSEKRSPSSSEGTITASASTCATTAMDCSPVWQPSSRNGSRGDHPPVTADGSGSVWPSSTRWSVRTGDDWTSTAHSGSDLVSPSSCPPPTRERAPEPASAAARQRPTASIRSG